MQKSIWYYSFRMRLFMAVLSLVVALAVLGAEAWVSGITGSEFSIRGTFLFMPPALTLLGFSGILPSIGRWMQCEFPHN